MVSSSFLSFACGGCLSRGLNVSDIKLHKLNINLSNIMNTNFLQDRPNSSLFPCGKLRLMVELETLDQVVFTL